MSRWLIASYRRRAMSLEDIKNLAKSGVYTHPSVYHADDIVSACMLKLTGVIDSYEQIQRGNIPENFKGLAFDIGEGEFDHHQKNTKLHEDKSRYAACTLLAEKLFDEDVYNKIYENFLHGIELTDNNGPIKYPNKFSHAVWACNSLKVPFVEACNLFEDVVRKAMEGEIPELTKGLQDKESEFAEFEKSQNEKVKQVIEEHPGESFVELDEYLPAFKFKGSGIKYTIVASDRNPGSWNLTATPGYTIPQEVRDYDGCSFLHPSGFLAVFNSKELAREVARQLV